MHKNNQCFSLCWLHIFILNLNAILPLVFNNISTYFYFIIHVILFWKQKKTQPKKLFEKSQFILRWSLNWKDFSDVSCNSRALDSVTCDSHLPFVPCSCISAGCFPDILSFSCSLAYSLVILIYVYSVS